LFQERYRYSKHNHATPEKFERGRMQQMSTNMQQNQIIEWRRAKVMELLSKGESNQSEIARAKAANGFH
jgi:hypothetical protein